MRQILNKIVGMFKVSVKNDALLRFLEVEEFDAAIILPALKQARLM